MVCLDSDVLIDFLRNEKYAVKILEELSVYDKLFIITLFIIMFDYLCFSVSLY